MDDFLAISALQHFAYCPRQFALIHVEQLWAENRFTAEGRILHERVDSGVAEQRRKVRFERGVSLASYQYGLIGKMDLLEIDESDATRPARYFPVEYKRGKPKVQDWDRVQLCAQALCIEEMREVEVCEGAIWYWQTRRREAVALTSELRATTIAAINAAHALLTAGTTPAPQVDPSRCRACSLVDQCSPQSFRQDRSAGYVQGLFVE